MVCICRCWAESWYLLGELLGSPGGAGFEVGELEVVGLEVVGLELGGLESEGLRVDGSKVRNLVYVVERYPVDN